MSKLTTGEWEYINDYLSGKPKERIKAGSIWHKIKDDLKPEEPPPEAWGPKIWLQSITLGEKDSTAWELDASTETTSAYNYMHFHWNLRQLQQELNGDWVPESSNAKYWIGWCYVYNEWSWHQSCNQQGFGPFRSHPLAQKACDILNAATWAREVFG